MATCVMDSNDHHHGVAGAHMDTEFIGLLVYDEKYENKSDEP